MGYSFLLRYGKRRNCINSQLYKILSIVYLFLVIFAREFSISEPYEWTFKRKAARISQDLNTCTLKSGHYKLDYGLVHWGNVFISLKFFFNICFSLIWSSCRQSYVCLESGMSVKPEFKWKNYTILLSIHLISYLISYTIYYILTSFRDCHIHIVHI